MASESELIFSQFRRDERYKLILEHVDKVMGQKYLDFVIKNDIQLLDYISVFQKNDIIGNPEVFDYENIGSISPTTLRYIKVLSDLRKYFGSLNRLNIYEIGVGYGGQCRIINSLYSPSIYTLVDLDSVLNLSKKFLEKFSLNTTLTYSNMNDLNVDSIDLLISNYAFSELRKNIQDFYIDKIISKSKHGYITFNEINPKYFNSYSSTELLEIIPKSFVVPEEPLTGSKNCIIIW